MPVTPTPVSPALNSAVVAAVATPPPRSVADILEAAGDLSDPAARERAVQEMRTFQQGRRAAAEARARELGLPLRTVGPRGRVREVFDLDAQGRPIYRATFNLNATRSSGASLLHAETPALSGSGVSVGVWDGGLVRSTHQELVGRVTAKDTGALDDHATHVAGTLGAAGVVATARGAAPAVSIHSYDWDDDYAEMTEVGATAAGQTTKLYIGNQSYGSANGWDYTGETNPMWIWYGTGTTTTGSDSEFGQYNIGARDIDAVIFSTPYLLAFRVAGNDGTDDPVDGERVSLSSTGSPTTAYNSSVHPPGDGIYRGGYDNIAWESIGKNVITIGATIDAVTGTQRDLAAAAVVDFSSWGPTDDGRIKPDLVANGDEVYSSIATSNTAYDTYSGTSMAGPSAAGSAALLVQLYGQLFPGNSMRASTLKALLLHTADDFGTPGPDYRSGWGLINVKTAADLLRNHAAHPLRIRVNERQLNTTSPTSITQEFTWDGVSPIRATLCWTDPAGAATTSHDSRTSSLVNNLDLKITGPDDSTHQPFVMPFVGAWTQASMALPATRGLNDTDNVEQVYIPTPTAPGVYRAVVTFRGTLTGDQQHYSLIISGSTSQAATPVAPSVTTHPVSQSVTAGEQVTFTVAITGTAPITYQWRKGGQPIANANNPTLTLTSVQAADAGDYDVVLTNSVGSATSNAATLTVNAVTTSTITWDFTTASPSSALPAGLTGGTITQGNNNGTTTMITSSATSSYSGASAGNNAGLAARTGSLNTATNGSAYYQFTLTPAAGSRLAATGLVFGARSTSTGPQAYALYTSADNYTTLAASGTMTNTSAWVLRTPSFTPVIGALDSPITFRLYGYNGSGTPSVGTANWRIDDLALTVAVQTPPAITTQPASQSVAAGGNVTFNVTATGTETLTYQWRHNGNTLAGATSNTLSLSGVQSTHAGNYDVVVTNPVASATSSVAVLTVSAAGGYNAWRNEHFDANEQANTAISGPSAVLTADGLTNLLKYALGRAPRESVDTFGTLDASSGQLVFTYMRPAARTELTYAVESSSDLINWSTVGVTHERVDTTAGNETWRATAPLAGGTRTFLRLRVSTQ